MHYSLQIVDDYVSIHKSSVVLLVNGIIESELLRLVRRMEEAGNRKKRMWVGGRFECGDKPDSFVMNNKFPMKWLELSPVIQLQSSSKSEHRQQTSMRWKMYLVNRVMSMFELCRFCVQSLSLDRQRPQQQHPYSLSSTLDISSNLSPHSLLIRDKHTHVVRVGVGVVIPVI